MTLTRMCLSAVLKDLSTFLDRGATTSCGERFMRDKDFHEDTVMMSIVEDALCRRFNVGRQSISDAFLGSGGVHHRDALKMCRHLEAKRPEMYLEAME